MRCRPPLGACVRVCVCACVRVCVCACVRVHKQTRRAVTRAERRRRGAPGVGRDPERLHAHARRRRRTLGAAAVVGVVGVGVRELGADARQ